jgi:hypothetical protein
MQRSFARLCSALMRALGKLVALRRPLLVAVASFAAWGTACDYTDYPLKPSFCDDWCRVFLRSECDHEPENCVRTCERSLGPAYCRVYQNELLTCYQRAPRSSFVCTGQGFQGMTRPEEHVCQNERDSLIDCAYPHVKQCLDVCRDLSAASAIDAQAPDAAVRPCPAQRLPCDSLCWSYANVASRTANSGGTHDAAGEDAESDASALEPLPALITCAIEAATECRLRHASDAGDAGPASNWSSLLLDCRKSLNL